MGNVYVTKFKVDAEIGEDEYSVQSVQILYQLNAPPVASVQLSIGKPINPDDTEVDSVEILLAAKIFTPIKIYLTATEYDTPQGADPLPSERTLIFDGYLAAPAARLGNAGGRGYASISLTAQGALSILSAVPRTISTLTAAVMANSGSDVNLTVTSVASQGKLKLTGIGACLNAAEKITLSQVIAIKEMMTNCVNASNAFQNRENSIEAATAAITRIKELESLSLEWQIRAMALAEAEEAFKMQLANFIVSRWFSGGNSNPEVMNNGSILEAFNFFRESFFWSHVPTVNFDYCVPLTLGLSGEPWRKITPNDYFSCQGATSHLGFNALGFVDSVVVYDEETVGSDLYDHQGWTARCGAAKLAAGEGSPGQEGKVFLMAAPEWLGVSTTCGLLSKSALKPGFAVPDSLNFDPKTEEEELEVEMNGILRSFAKSGIADAVAQTVLYSKAFSSRKLNFTGRVRFDIAPGSLLEVQVPGNDATATPASLYGHVESVTIDIDGGDGGTGGASTSFALTAVRTAYDHEKLTAATHPLYRTSFRGIGLLQ